jgi:hypothetical protein
MPPVALEDTRKVKWCQINIKSVVEYKLGTYHKVVEGFGNL